MELEQNPFVSVTGTALEEERETVQESVDSIFLSF
jgi:hypothetical protein